MAHPCETSLALLVTHERTVSKVQLESIICIIRFHFIKLEPNASVR